MIVSGETRVDLRGPANEFAALTPLCGETSACADASTKFDDSANSGHGCEFIRRATQIKNCNQVKNVSMNSDWFLVLILAFSNIGNYFFAAPGKKREAGVQAFTASISLLSSFCIARFVLANIIASEVSFALAVFLMLLTFGLVYFAIGSLTWRIFRRFLQKR